MNRSSKGFGLAGVVIAVIFMVVAAAVTSPSPSIDTVAASATQS